MGDLRYPFVMITTFLPVLVDAANTNITITKASQAASIRDRIPPRLGTVLRGEIEFVSMNYATGTVMGANGVDIAWFGNSNFNTSTEADVDFLGLQNLTPGDIEDGGLLVDAQDLHVPHRSTDGNFHVAVYNNSGQVIPAGARLQFAYRPELGTN